MELSQMVKLFVGGFPLDMEEMELVKVFNTFAEIKTIKIVRDKATRKCKGYAFLETTGQAGVEMAVNALHGKMMGDKELTVRIVEDKPPVELPAIQKQVPAVKYIKVEKPTGPVKKKRPRKLL
jgi:RNA recognition motif-containing protein